MKKSNEDHSDMHFRYNMKGSQKSEKIKVAMGKVMEYNEATRQHRKKSKQDRYLNLDRLDKHYVRR